jgi:tight adherence protein B
VNHLAVAAIAAALVMLIAIRWRPRRGRRIDPPDRADPGGPRHHPHISLRARRAEHQPASARAVAEWCDDLARQLRSGTTLSNALATSLPHDRATRRSTDDLRQRLDRGQSVIAAVESAPVSDVGPNLRLALSVITTAAKLGGSPAPAIDRTASTLRQRAADADERRVHAAQARLSAHVLTAVPIAMLLLLFVTDSDVRVTATSTLGATCIGMGLSLNAIGSVWMRRIIGTRS